MIDQDEIDNQQERLATHRRTLAHYLSQQAKLGEAYTPPGVIHGIDEARAYIRTIKNLLRSKGLTIEDYLDDEPRVPTTRLAAVSNAAIPPRPLRVFLCHSSGDKPDVYKLYQRLRADGFEPWLDNEDLVPGQDWRMEIPRAVRAADVVLVCLSRGAITKQGYIQQEIEFALDAAYDQPVGAIYLIPLKLKECTVPDRLGRWQWVNLFEYNGYERLRRALQIRSATLGLTQISSLSQFVIEEPSQVSRPLQSKVHQPSLSLRIPFDWVRRRANLLATHGRAVFLISVGFISFMLIIIIAYNQFSPQLSAANNMTPETIGQLPPSPTEFMTSVPTELPLMPGVTALATLAPTKLSTQLPTAFATITPKADAVIKSGGLLRTGPGENYDAIAIYGTGSELTVLGRSSDSEWINVKTSDGKAGWMSTTGVEMNSNLSAKQVLSAPPTPTLDSLIPLMLP